MDTSELSVALEKEQTAPERETRRIAALGDEVLQRGPQEAFELLEPESDETIALVLAGENPAIADEILWEFAEDRRKRILEAAPAEQREQWARNHEYPEDSIGRLMDPLVGVLKPSHTVAEVIERLRPIVKKVIVPYGWVVDDLGRLTGVVVFRELLFADRTQKISDVMVKNPFSLS